tara:strand:+ start:2112 stop:2309 length:198 start_codon:yes stop_codon:yes gene_type:complete
MPKSVFDVLTDKIDEQISSAQSFVAGGSPKDYPAYREVVGLIRGLESAKLIIEDLSRNFMDNDDD